MQQYRDLLHNVLITGTYRDDRTGTGTRSVFGRQIRCDLNDGFPLLTSKRVPFRLVVAELLWFLEGSTDNNRLAELSGCRPETTIWAEWATDHGGLGPIYGKQWRSWECPNGVVIDQISSVIEQIKADPYSRRHIVSAWNPAVTPAGWLSPQQNAATGRMALAPCHVMFQFYVDNDALSCQVYQRSADIFIGVPFNIASYALLTHIIAAECGLDVGEFVHTFGDLHLYENHVQQAGELLSRAPRELPKLHFEPKPIDAYTPDDFQLVGYNPHPPIPAPVAV